MLEKLKWLLPRLPLPMLALSASYGVYKFALLFVPQWVAIIQASAFEMTYIGLATIEAETVDQKRRAVAISVGAVVVSVLYNSLAGFFHRNALGSMPLLGEVILAVLHGAPLAIVAYLVADLLLHKSQEPAATVATSEKPVALPLSTPEPTLDDLLSRTGKTRQEMLAILERFGMMNTEAKYVYDTLQRHGALPEGITPERFAVLLKELKAASSPIHANSSQPASKPRKTVKKASDGPTKRSRVRATLDEHGNLKDSELYELLPDIGQSSVRVHASEWRKEQLMATNGKH